jgi:hypothetical protein|tara:strand:+ start:6658 stop:7158 length:501 start_codon:yes stop_codon:yes gene_type:complete
MIKEINTGIPSNTNKGIIKHLYSSQNWHFGWDQNSELNINKKDSGLILNINNSNNPVLSTYAQIIFDVVEKNTAMQFKKIERIYWNWYHPGSITEFHEDSAEDNKFSIVYNLHDNDGGTEFIINDEVKFVESKESMAISFPSKVKHRGISPKKNLNRFALNMVLEI